MEFSGAKEFGNGVVPIAGALRLEKQKCGYRKD
jgi:hypothetical protein